MIIDKFKPDFFEGEAEIDYEFLEEMFGHKMKYASKGRHSIRHIIAASGKTGTAVIPIYACSSIPEAIRKSGNEVVFCDIDDRDLNISVDALINIVSTRKVTFLLVPSLYGNPADLETIERICQERNIYMIDDAAQSFGARIGERYVGSFGNAGFFSFSPGKPLTGSMGSFFWSDNDKYHVEYEYGHGLLHNVAFKDYYYNRFKIYDRGVCSPYKALSYLNIILQKRIDILNDGMSKQERNNIGIIIDEYKNGHIFYRQELFNRLVSTFSGNNKFRVLSCIRGIANNTKCVLVFNDFNGASSFREYLLQRKIYSSGGYKLLSDSNEFKVAQSIKQRIVEVPIENSRDKMDYLIETIDRFLH